MNSKEYEILDKLNYYDEGPRNFPKVFGGGEFIIKQISQFDS